MLNGLPFLESHILTYLKSLGAYVNKKVVKRKKEKLLKQEGQDELPDFEKELIRNQALAQGNRI
jgi:hypothetical protein